MRILLEYLLVRLDDVLLVVFVAGVDVVSVVAFVVVNGFVGFGVLVAVVVCHFWQWNISVVKEIKGLTLGMCCFLFLYCK